MNKHLINFLPSFFWFLFIILGFFLNYEYLNQTARSIQVKNILVVFIFFFLADLYCYRLQLKKINNINVQKIPGNLIIYFTLFIILIFIIFHIYSLSKFINIKIFLEELKESYFGKSSEEFIFYNKNFLNKLLDVPVIIKYCFNVIYNIAIPFAAITILYKKKMILFFIFNILIVSYSTLINLRFIIWYLLLIYLIFIFLWLIEKLKFKKIFYFFLVLFVIFLIDVYNVKNQYKNHPDLTKNNSEVLKKNLIHKLKDDGDLKNKYDFRQMIINRYYRLILIPPEVGNSWYQYFIFESKKQPVFFDNFFAKYDGHNTYARKIGLWAYHSKDPIHYSKLINANVSFDADSTLRFGFLGFFISLTIITFLRILAAKVHNDNYLSNVIYILFLCSFVNFPSISLQSYLISQGFILLIPLIYFFKNKKIL